jgi:hypothetical protein
VNWCKRSVKGSEGSEWAGQGVKQMKERDWMRKDVKGSELVGKGKN